MSGTTSAPVRARAMARRSVAAVCAEGFLARLGFGVITFALPFYALSLGMSVTEIGALAATRLAAAILVKPVMGWAADRFGNVRVYTASIACRAAVGVLFVVATTPWALFAIRALHGVATAARDPASAVLLAERAEDERVASAFAWYHTAKEAGASLGYLAAGLLLRFTHDDYRVVFSFAVLTSLVALALVGALVREATPSGARPEEAAPPGPGGGWIRYAGLAVLVATGGSMVNNLFPILATVHGRLDKADVGVLLTASSLTVILAGPALGWLSDRVSRKPVLALRSAANVLSSVLYLACPGFAGFCAARLADDVGKAAFRPTWGALMADVAFAGAAWRRGRVVGYMDTAQSAGDALGPLLAGLLWDGWGVGSMFAARILIAVLAEGYAAWALSPKDTSRAPPATILGRSPPS